jgi:hypothetical protein
MARGVKITARTLNRAKAMLSGWQCAEEDATPTPDGLWIAVAAASDGTYQWATDYTEDGAQVTAWRACNARTMNRCIIADGRAWAAVIQCDNGSVQAITVSAHDDWRYTNRVGIRERAHKPFVSEGRLLADHA